MVLKELIFNKFPLWEGVVVLKELFFNSFLFGVCGVHERSFLIVCTLGGCSGLERTDF